MTSNNKNKSLEARPPHSTPGRPAVIVTSLPSGGNVDLSSSSSSPKPGCRGSSCLPSFPVPPPPSDSLGDVRGRRVMAFLAWQRQLLRGALPRSLSAQPATQPSARPSSQPRTQPSLHASLVSSHTIEYAANDEAYNAAHDAPLLSAYHRALITAI